MIFTATARGASHHSLGVAGRFCFFDRHRALSRIVQDVALAHRAGDRHVLGGDRAGRSDAGDPLLHRFHRGSRSRGRGRTFSSPRSCGQASWRSSASATSIFPGGLSSLSPSATAPSSRRYSGRHRVHFRRPVGSCFRAGTEPGQTLVRIVLPQAVRNVLPPMGNEFVAMIKDSALVSALGVQDITQMGKVYAASTFKFFETVQHRRFSLSLSYDHAFHAREASGKEAENRAQSGGQQVGPQGRARIDLASRDSGPVHRAIPAGM